MNLKRKDMQHLLQTSELDVVDGTGTSKASNLIQKFIHNSRYVYMIFDRRVKCHRNVRGLINLSNALDPWGLSNNPMRKSTMEGRETHRSDSN